MLRQKRYMKFLLTTYIRNLKLITISFIVKLITLFVVHCIQVLSRFRYVEFSLLKNIFVKKVIQRVPPSKNRATKFT